MTTKTTTALKIVTIAVATGLVMGGVLDALTGVFFQPHGWLGNLALAIFGGLQFTGGFMLLDRVTEPEPESHYANRLRESAAASESAAAWHYANRLREEIARIDPTTASSLSLKLRDVMTRKLRELEGK